CVETGGEQLRCGKNDRCPRLHILEPLHVTAADVAFVGGDAADVVGKLLNQIGVQVVECRAHLGGVFLVYTEDNGFGEAVCLLQEVGQVPGHGLGPCAQRHTPLEVGRGV